ncbi:hypothetical protein DFH09DRAFT_1342028 [Mycena vulgaris]|nr:hypothetical protein DFH09DRAFT_1342028 [Mycena vulgaris]
MRARARKINICTNEPSYCRTVTPARVLVRVPEDGSWRQRAPTVQNKLSDVRVRRCRTTHGSARPGPRARRRFVAPARARRSEEAQRRPRAPLLRNPHARVLVRVPEDGLWRQCAPAVQRKLGSIRGRRCGKTHARARPGPRARRQFVASARAPAVQRKVSGIRTRRGCTTYARARPGSRQKTVCGASVPAVQNTLSAASAHPGPRFRGRFVAPARTQDTPSGVRAPLRHTHASVSWPVCQKIVAPVHAHRSEAG